MGAAVRAISVLCMAVLMVSCGEATTSDHLVLEASEVAHLEEKAGEGDVASMKRLASHFGASSQLDRERYWNAQARQAGDPQELYFEAARLEARARTVEDKAERLRLLDEALTNIQRAKSSEQERPSDYSISQLEARILAAQRQMTSE